MANKALSLLARAGATQAVLAPVRTATLGSYRPTITVLRSQSTPLTKRFYLDAQGQTQREDYLNAKTFQAASYPIEDIEDLSELLIEIAEKPDGAVVRGIPARPGRNIWRNQEELPEHEVGTSWAMLDIDGEELPPGMSPVSVEAVEWFVKKLPDPFARATCHYQFSGSAGVLDADGSLLKPGLRVHLFYFFENPIRGMHLASYLNRFCQDTNQYQISAGAKGVTMFKYMIDPAPIRSSNQLHYTAAPILEEGVRCLLADCARNGLLVRETSVVTLPSIDTQHVIETSLRQRALLDNWKRVNGYTRGITAARTNTGVQIQRFYQSPTPTGTHQRGYTLKGTDESRENVCRLFFEEEGSPGSWRVFKANPQIARRYGDEETVALKELSEQAPPRHNGCRLLRLKNPGGGDEGH
ncbi:MAG: hypothetical protein Q8M93_22535 [Polaromonas sp.]|uniref:hypothetical protein n=1 Tax=Polaromonas sp. TaxID=1869339 RepID=UPI0027321C14|nr:hypothetical protein [Polaromonas sp.]MDP2449407.1 hypothetical protein [Polaromonas sp.]MDP3249729.1 hypothetical protein [Polaromonas sp.]MDP3755246.1 hypothetical protein [Polaromonas sp.]